MKTYIVTYSYVCNGGRRQAHGEFRGLDESDVRIKMLAGKFGGSGHWDYVPITVTEKPGHTSCAQKEQALDAAANRLL